MSLKHVNFLWIVVAGLSWPLSPPATAQTEPLLQISVKSTKGTLEKIRTTVKTCFEAAGQGSMFGIVEGGMANSIGLTGEKIAGLDVTKPILLSVTYKPGAGQLPIDGDILVAFPTSDAKKFAEEGITRFGFAKATPGEGQLLNSSLMNGRAPIFARAANGYLYATVADPSVVSPMRLPSASKIVNEATHDFSFLFRPRTVPLDVRKSIVQTLSGLVAAASGGVNTPEQAAAQLERPLVETDAIEFHLDIDDKTQKLTITAIEKPAANSKVAQDLAQSTDGPLKSKIILADDAIATYVQRGPYIKTSYDSMKGYFEKAREETNAIEDQDEKDFALSLLSLADASFETGFEDLAYCIDKDLTLLAAVAVKDGEAVNKLLKETVEKGLKFATAKKSEVGDLASKFATDAGDAGSIKLVKFAVPLPKGQGVISGHAGVLDNVLIIAAGPKSKEAMEATSRRVVIANRFPMLEFKCSLQALAEAVGEKDFVAEDVVATVRVTESAQYRTEIPIKDIAELFKRGVHKKLAEKWGIKI